MSQFTKIALLVTVLVIRSIKYAMAVATELATDRGQAGEAAGCANGNAAVRTLRSGAVRTIVTSSGLKLKK